MSTPISNLKVILAEKPSVAREIASVIKATTKRSGFIEGKGVAVTWAFGHLVGLKEPDEYRADWKPWRLDTLPILPGRFELRARGDDSAHKQLNVITALFKQADEIICATDAGREGELIFRYICEWARCTRKPMRRLWISSLTSQSILNGLKSMKPAANYENLHQAARCRSQADWIVGMNGTRFFSVRYGERRQLWSVGRVQTPILALIVNRDLEIENFKPEDYWELHTLYREVRFKHVKGKFRKEEDARAWLEKVREAPFEILDVDEAKKRELPPLLYDLTNLQKDMNRRFGMTADQTLQVAQGLYEKKHLTYPRTDSQYLSSDMKAGVPKLLTTLAQIRPEEIGALDLTNLKLGPRIVNDAKVGDHHAIIPTEVLPRLLSAVEQQVYDAAVVRLIAAVYPPCIKAVTTVRGQAAAEPFKTRGTVVVDPGWQVLYPKPKPKQKLRPTDAKKATSGETQEMPRFEVGESGPHEPEVLKKQTTPPKHFTEHSLLNMMETAGKIVQEEELKEALKEKGVGTPATRAAIIETLIRREYIRREKKNLLSSPSGRHLIRLVKDDRLKSVELTGEWESRLRAIEKGEYAPETFMQEVETYTRELLRQTDADYGNCPCCGKPILKGKRGFGCSGYQEGCNFVLWFDQFGADIGPGLAREILQCGKSLSPLPLQIDGTPAFGRIVIGDDGEPKVERCEAVGPGNANASGALGTCPACKGLVRETPKGYTCANSRNGCRFVIWKTIAKKKISPNMAKELLKKGQTRQLKGFVSRAGKKFDARLRVIDGEVKFVFQDPPNRS